jgi:hypothetical protein
MWEWFWYVLPFELKLGLFAMIAAALFIIAGTAFGFDRVRRFILPAIAIVVTLGMVNKFQKQGWDAKAKKEMKIADKHIERARRARAAAEQANADPKKLREDDGFRRD